MPTNLNRRIVVLALFIHHYQWGKQIRGDERRFVELCKQFERFGLRVTAIEVAPSIQEAVGGVGYHSIKLREKFSGKESMINRIVLLFRLTLSTLLISRHMRFDLIYTHNQDEEDIIPAYFLRVIRRKPLVLVFQLSPSVLADGMKDRVASRIQRGFNPLSAFAGAALDTLTEKIYQRADYYITNSQTVKQALSEIGLPNERIAVAGNGVNTSTFRPTELQKAYDAVFLGRLHPQKGIDVLLNAWKQVSNEVPSATLLIIGGGYDHHVKRYREQIRTLNLEKNVQMVGFVSDETLLVRMLNSSRMFVFPSRYEGFALSVAEAMACGLPCVLTDLPVFRERYEGAALFAGIDDSESLSEAILRLMKDEALSGEMRKKALDRAANFKWEDVAQKELRVFKLLSSEKR